MSALARPSAVPAEIVPPAPSRLRAVPKMWMTAGEIAALRLPSAPHTESGVVRLAKREEWNESGFARPREGRGGGLEYNIQLLPPAAIAELVQLERTLMWDETASKIALAAKQEIEEAAGPAQTLTARQRLIMEARAALLSDIDRRVATSARTQAKAVASLIRELSGSKAAGELAQAAAVASERDGVPSRSQLYAWLKLRHEGGVTALAPKPKRVKDPLPKWFDDYLQFYARPQKPDAAHALEQYGDSLDDPTAAPSYAQVRRALAKLKPLEKLAGREGKLALRKRLAYVSRDTSDLLPSTVYVADGKTFDAEIAHPLHGRPFRPELTSIIDAATRVCTGWSIDLSETAATVADALQMSCTLWGIPAMFYTDRGPGYVAGAMTDPVTGVLSRAGITPMKALPYNSQAKGIVERFNMHWRRLSKEYPTYINRDMDKEAGQAVHKQTRRELATIGTSRLLPSFPDFIGRVGRMVERYNNKPHNALPKIVVDGRRRRMTPIEAWNVKCAEGFEPIKPGAHEVDDLFRPYEVRKARRCLVELFTNNYFAPELEAYDGLDVAVGYDIKDASRVWIRAIDRTAGEALPGALIAIGAFEGNRTRYVSVTAERQAMEKRARGRQQRLDRKAADIAAELNPTALLEHDHHATVVSLDLHRSPMPVASNDAAPAAPSRAPVLKLRPGGRPVFRSDADLVRWLLDNRGAAKAGDLALIRELLGSRTHQEMLRTSGIDLPELREFLKAATARPEPILTDPDRAATPAEYHPDGQNPDGTRSELS